MSLSDQLCRHRFHESRWAADIDAWLVVGGPSRHWEITDADPARRPGGLRRGRPGVDHSDLQPVTVALKVAQLLGVVDVGGTAHRVDEPKLRAAHHYPL